MNPPNHVARWIAAGVGVLALAGAGTATATTEPPDDTTMGAETTSMAAETTSMGSEPTGAGPSDCPAITEESEGSEAAEDTGAAEGTEAEGTEATEGTAAAETSAAVEATETTTAETMAVDVSAAPMAGPAVQIVETDEYGPILADGDCVTLYAFTQDTEGEPTCVDDCAANWPPALVDDETVPPLADELDPSLFSVVDHPDGPMLKIGDWPLYHFAGDAGPGETNGQGVGGVWWVVAPDGTLIETEEGAEGSEAAGSEAAGSEPADTAMGTTEG